MSDEVNQNRQPWEIFYLDEKLKAIAKEIKIEYYEKTKPENLNHIENTLYELTDELPENQIVAYRQSLITFMENKEKAIEYVQNRLLDFEKEVFMSDKDFFVERFIKHLKYFYFVTLCRYPEFFQNEERYIHIHP